jgi:hypothetical protein
MDIHDFQRFSSEAPRPRQAGTRRGLARLQGATSGWLVRGFNWLDILFASSRDKLSTDGNRLKENCSKALTHASSSTLRQPDDIGFKQSAVYRLFTQSVSFQRLSSHTTSSLRLGDQRLLHIHNPSHLYIARMQTTQYYKMLTQATSTVMYWYVSQAANRQHIHEPQRVPNDYVVASISSRSCAGTHKTPCS